MDEVFDPLVQTLLDVVASSPMDGVAPVLTEANRMRNACVGFLNVVPLLCKASAAVVDGIPAFAYIMFYERTRMGAFRSPFFLEGCAPRVKLFSGPVTVPWSETELRTLTARHLQTHRRGLVAALEKKTPAKLAAAHDTFKLADLPVSLPPHIHCFVHRLRSLCQTLRRVKPGHQFRVCRHARCARLFFSPGPHALDPHCPPSTKDEPEYWRAASKATAADAIHDLRNYCSSNCFRESAAEYGRLPAAILPELLEPDVFCRKEGRPRIAEALRQVSKRNEVLGREIRAFRLHPPKMHALSPQRIKTELARRIRMLNLDLCLLYAASTLATTSGRRSLPGQTATWRNSPYFRKDPLTRLARLYSRFFASQHHDEVLTMTHQHAIFSKVREKANTLFQ